MARTDQNTWDTTTILRKVFDDDGFLYSKDEAVLAAIEARNKIDSITGARTTIEYEHHEVHDGRSFIVADVQNVSTTTIKWMVTTPNTLRYSHMLFEVHCTGEMLVLITEGADRTGTNALTVVNKRRPGTPNVAGTIVHRGVSGGATDGATTINTLRIGATGVGNKTVEAGNAHAAEFILKPNTKYVIAVTTYANVYVTAHFDWYEHIDS